MKPTTQDPDDHMKPSGRSDIVQIDFKPQVPAFPRQRPLPYSCLTAELSIPCEILVGRSWHTEEDAKRVQEMALAGQGKAQTKEQSFPAAPQGQGT
jgi:hypothetical protein